MSRSLRASRLNKALVAGIISVPGYSALLTNWSNRTRPSSGRKRNSPATRVRKQRPAVRTSVRRSAISGVSGETGAAAEDWIAGRPSCGRTKRGGDHRSAFAIETDRPSSAEMTPDNQTAARFHSAASLRQRRRARLRTDDDKSLLDRERTPDSVCHPSGTSKNLIGFPPRGCKSRSLNEEATRRLEHARVAESLILGLEMRCTPLALIGRFSNNT